MSVAAFVCRPDGSETATTVSDDHRQRDGHGAVPSAWRPGRAAQLRMDRIAPAARPTVSTPCKKGRTRNPLESAVILLEVPKPLTAVGRRDLQFKIAVSDASRLARAFPTSAAATESPTAGELDDCGRSLFHLTFTERSCVVEVISPSLNAPFPLDALRERKYVGELLCQCAH